MSFDVVVWESERDLDDDEAYAIYKGITRGEEVSLLKTGKRLSAFYDRMIREYPEPSADLGEEEMEENPWSGPITRTERYLIFSIRPDFIEDMGFELSDRAGSEGLTVYDPQSGRVFNPL